jgi:hypothetical protein
MSIAGTGAVLLNGAVMGVRYHRPLPRTPASLAVAARPRKRAVLEPGHGVATLFNHLVSFAVSPRDVVFSTADGSAPSAQTLRRLWDARR